MILKLLLLKEPKTQYNYNTNIMKLSAKSPNKTHTESQQGHLKDGLQNYFKNEN